MKTTIAGWISRGALAALPRQSSPLSARVVRSGRFSRAPLRNAPLVHLETM